MPPTVSELPEHEAPDMNAELFEEILACPTLPSLPAVAMEVMELTSNPNVSMDELAERIQLDQALAAKIVRTVNSSYYGLRKPCANVRKALVMLGLGPVKTLALGFSLVGSLSGLSSEGFDWEGYWRRSLYSALAARCFAEAGTLVDKADEVFLAALMQDIGMIALNEALGAEYLAVIAATRGDHHALARHETEAFETNHAEVGAMLAAKWRMPRELTIPIRYHEKPTAAPGDESGATRLIALGVLVHDVLTERESAPHLRRLYEKAKSFCGFEPSVCDDVIRQVSAHAREMSSLFNVDTGAACDADEVLARAMEALVELSKSGVGPGAALLGGGDEAFATVPHDPLTGAVGKEGFAVATQRAFELAKTEADRVATVVHIAIEGLAGVTDRYGELASNEAIMGLATLINRSFEPMGGLVCRVGASIFAVVLPDVGRRDVVRALDEMREQICIASTRWSPDTKGEPMAISISAGVASLENESRSVFSTDKLLVGASARATQAARAAGGDCVRSFVPRLAA